MLVVALVESRLAQFENLCSILASPPSSAVLLGSQSHSKVVVVGRSLMNIRIRAREVYMPGHAAPG